MSAPRLAWYVVINSDGLVLAVYGSALLDVAQEKARALHVAPCSVSLRLIRTSKRPHVGFQLALKSEVVGFRQHGLDQQGWFPSLESK
jgi:hypothetical protein